MRKQDYVSIEVAKLLKKHGFDELCLSQYTKSGSIWNCQEPENFNESEGSYSRPTVYEARDWIMKKYNIVLLMDWKETFSSRNGYSPLHFGFKIYKKLEVRGYYETMEQALDAGILYVLKNEDLWKKTE